MSAFVFRPPAKVIQDILQSEMGLTDGQVMSSNQKFLIPTDGLYIYVSYLGPGKIISSQDEWIDDGGDGLTEIQSVTMLDMLDINLMSYDNSARDRRTEVAMALHSIYSQQLQEQYSMQIGRNLGSMFDTSFLEETKMITRYTSTIMVTSVNRKDKAVRDIYTDFSRAVPPQLVVDA